MSWLNEQYEMYKRTNQVPFIIALWLPYHLVAAFLIYYCFTVEFHWWYLALMFAGWVTLDGIGNNLTLHRLLSHQSWSPRPWMKPFLYWLAAMVAEGSPLWWAALHRGHHHKVSDQVGKDIHTPKDNGWWHSYMGWQFKIRQNSVSFRYVVDLLRDKKLVFVHEHYNKIIYSTLLVTLFIFGWEVTAWFWIMGSLSSLHADGFVNTFGHVPAAGYRNFDTKDQSTNVYPIGYLHWGSGWHNNHHQDASSFDFGTSVSGRAHEFDGCMILMLPFAPIKEIKRLWGKRRDAIIKHRQ
jgi:fatty-acid desaturase